MVDFLTEDKGASKPLDNSKLINLTEAEHHFARIVEHDLHPKDKELIQASLTGKNFILSFIERISPKDPILLGEYGHDKGVKTQTPKSKQESYVAPSDFRAIKFAELGIEMNGLAPERKEKLETILDTVLNRVFKQTVDRVPAQSQSHSSSRSKRSVFQSQPNGL